jgi:hypothetical protein
MKSRVGLIAVALISASAALANTAIETETAQIGKQGDVGISNAYEHVHSNDGSGGGTLTQVEYAITDRSELLIEPFFYVWDHPDGESREHGYGDLEITPSYMVILEDGWVPAVLIATKVKVPTGSQRVGGSGEYDYYPYLIFGQHYGGWIFNANIGVNFAGREEGDGFDRTTVWDLEAEHEFGNWTTFWEAYSAEDGVNTASTALQYQWLKHMNVFGVLGYNEDHETIFRAGFNLEF